MGFKAEEMNRLHGTEVGISEAMYRVSGPFAYGYMNCERGTHRLARVSPFNAEGKRQTSFATVEVTPNVRPGAAGAVSLVQPVCKMILVPGGYNPGAGAGVITTGATFRAQQTLR